MCSGEGRPTTEHLILYNTLLFNNTPTSQWLGISPHVMQKPGIHNTVIRRHNRLFYESINVYNMITQI